MEESEGETLCRQPRKGRRFQLILMESSGSYAAERVDHTMEDTWKLIILTTDSLRTELINYQDGRFDTVKELAIYGAMHSEYSYLAENNKL